MSTPPELEQEVRRLLAAGKSERAIVDLLGTSRRQVANIKKKVDEDKDDNLLAPDIGPTMERSDAIAELVMLSTRPQGVRPSEMWPVLRGLFGMRTNDKSGQLELTMTDNQRRYLKEQAVAAAAAQGKEALHLPEWLPRQGPVEANDMLVMYGWRAPRPRTGVCFRPTDHLPRRILETRIQRTALPGICTTERRASSHLMPTELGGCEAATASP